jgi:hypothetical protein
MVPMELALVELSCWIARRRTRSGDTADDFKVPCSVVP